MSLLALLLAAPAASAGPAPVPPLTLLQAFRTYCHERRADRHAAVLAAGFTPVPAAPPGDAGSETAAWEKDGIRLFEMSGQADRYLLLPAACGVSANVGMEEDSNAFEAPFIADPDYLWLEVTHHNRQIYWNLILRSGFVRASFDRTDPAAVRMTFAGTGEPLPQSETR